MAVSFELLITKNKNAISENSLEFLIVLSVKSFLQTIAAWFPPMRLTYSHVCSYENKHNPIGGNALKILKKN